MSGRIHAAFHRDWRSQLPIAAALLWLALAMPPLRHALEASMAAQMLLQIPALIAAGLLLARAIPARVNVALAGVDHRGVTGLALATVVMALWMLPRWLDASVGEPSMAVAKYLMLPLLVGLPLGLSWPRMGFIVRGVFVAETIATLFRMGWLYLVWPDRLCNNYLLGDQQRLGQYMVAIGVALALWVAWKLLWGRLQTFAETPRASQRPR